MAKKKDKAEKKTSKKKSSDSPIHPVSDLKGKGEAEKGGGGDDSD